MKVTQKIFSFLVLAAAVLTGCERDYDAPPLNEPVYEGPSANITIADLKENCKNATQETPVVITNDWVLKAYVTGNDESGNIYKQVIVQDETEQCRYRWTRITFLISTVAGKRFL